MLIPFRKMQAQGNDFAILLHTQRRELNLPLSRLARDICDRRKGVGADGLVILLYDPEADARMEIHNSDGSRASMCGSALRCCSLLISELKKKDNLRIATDSGIKTAFVRGSDDGKDVEVNLGKPRLRESELEVEGARGTLVDVGNLHFISFWEALDGQEFRLGPVFEKHPVFPGQVNSQFARVITRGEIELRIWETGCGATQACGTGAVATVFAGIEKGMLDSCVKVRMPGGEVLISRVDNGEYTLAGGVEHVFSGVYLWKTWANT